MPRILLLIALIWAFAAPVYAQTDPARLDEIRREEQDAKAREAKLAKERDVVRADISKLKSDLVKAAAEAESYERASREIAEKLSALQREETRVKTAQFSDREAVIRLLGALQRLESNPPPALIVSPSDAGDAARAARLMTELTKTLKTRAESLSVKLEELTVLRAEISTEKTALAKNETDVAARRTKVKALVDEKQGLEKSISENYDAEVKRVAALAKEADSLQELIASVGSATRGVEPRLKPDPGTTGSTPRLKPSAGRPPEPLVLPPDTLRFADARGALRLPLRGRIEKKYSNAHRGITLSARSQAQVVSPYAGRIEFTGPFKNYENVIILNVGEGYFIVLTGIGDVYAELGETVRSGEPLGVMPYSVSQKANLYIEFWKGSAQINPMPWLGTALAEAG